MAQKLNLKLKRSKEWSNLRKKIKINNNIIEKSQNQGKAQSSDDSPLQKFIFGSSCQILGKRRHAKSSGVLPKFARFF